MEHRSLAMFGLHFDADGNRVPRGAHVIGGRVS